MSKSEPYNAPFVKICTKCKVPKLSTEFNRHTQIGLQPRCKSCRKQDRIEWEASHKEQVKEHRRAYRKKHKDAIANRRRRWVRTPSGKESRKAAMWRHKVKLRTEMIDAYGGRCECCEETEYFFLTLEHKNGGGTAHRKQFGVLGVLVDLKRRGWPKDEYTVLCYNCNMATKDGRICPHQQAKEQAA